MAEVGLVVFAKCAGIMAYLATIASWVSGAASAMNR